MEINVSTHIQDINSQKIDVDMNVLENLVKEFVSKLENEGLYDEETYSKIEALGVNKKVLEKMTNALDLFSGFDEDKTSVDFPYKDWLTRLILINENYKK